MTSTKTVMRSAKWIPGKSHGELPTPTDRSRQCQFCYRIFARQDSLRRHYSACSKKGKEHLVIPEKRGRKRRVCDLCRSQKIQCDAKLPCNRCSVKQAVCSYGSLSSAKREVPSATNSGDDLASIQLHGRSPTDSRCPVPFLLSYTDPKFESITYAFAASDAHVEALIDEEVDIESDDTLETAQTGSNLSSNHADNSIVQMRVTEIITALVHHRQNTEPAQSNIGTDSLNYVAKVFTAYTLPRYISAYFNYFHPHFRFIHRPTFAIHTTPLPLLLAVALAGAAHSPPTDDALSANSIYSLAEEFIFACLQEACATGSGREEDTIAIAQAAILISSLLYSANSRVMAWRGLYYRTPVLVALIRRLGLTGTRLTMPSKDMSWRQFIAQESRIRLVASIFFSGCVNTLSFNSIPQITVSEMIGDTPVSDALFEATSETEFVRLRCDTLHSIELRRSLKDWVTLYLDDEWGSSDELADALEPSGLTLHILAIQKRFTVRLMDSDTIHDTKIFTADKRAALHSVIYSARTSLLSTSSHTSLSRALSRWKEIHDLVYARQVCVQLVGFVKYSIELWWLGRKLLEKLRAGCYSGRYCVGIPTDSLADLREFIEDCGTGV